jgi:hypothetical protein
VRPSLLPETADTEHAGHRADAGWNSRKACELSVDYYRIKLKGGIQRGSSQLVVNNCQTLIGQTGSVDQCPLVGFGLLNGQPNRNDIESVMAPYYNDAPYEAGRYRLRRQLHVRYRPGRSHDVHSAAHFACDEPEHRDRHGASRAHIWPARSATKGSYRDYTSAPDWSVNLIASYTSGPFTITTQGRYTSSGLLRPCQPRGVNSSDPLYDP